MGDCGPGVGLWGGLRSPVLDMLPWEAHWTPRRRCGKAADYESGARKSELGWRHPLGLALRWD